MVMARLLKNRLESYVNNVNRAEADYMAQADIYNNTLSAAKKGTPTVMKDANGNDVIVGGTVEDKLKLISSKIFDASTLGDVPAMQLASRYGRDSEGNVAKYKVEPYTEMVYAPTHSRPYSGFGSAPTETTVSGYRWVKQGENLAVMPDIPQVNAPQQPNLTQSNLKELKNPSYDPAGVVAMGNYGIDVKSQLAGEVANSRVSAFADPEDPNNLAERGILARTLAGQLG